MPKVRLDLLQEGMVTAKDIKNMDAMLLIPAGCELTARHIDLLHTWGVAEIQVEAGGEGSDSADPVNRLAPGVAAALKAEIMGRFTRWEENNPVQAEIFTLLVRRKARQILES